MPVLMVLSTPFTVSLEYWAKPAGAWIQTMGLARSRSRVRKSLARGTTCERRGGDVLADRGVEPM